MLLFNLLFLEKSVAQFYPAIHLNSMASSSKQVVNTGNDVINYPNNGTETIRTIVYDGDTPSLFYEFLQIGTSVNSGTVSLNYSDAIDPDVALIAKNTSGWRAYALVSYSRPGGGIYLEIFRFDYSINNFAQQQLISIGSSSTSIVNTTINIDSDQQDRFAVTWDELGGSGQILTYAGYVNGVGGFVFSPSAVLLPVPLYCGPPPPGLPNLAPLKQPDVAVFSAGGGGGGIANCIVNYSMIDDLGDIHLGAQRFVDLINGTTSNSWSFSIEALNGDVYNLPRIACQRYNATVSFAQTGVSIVYEIYNPNTQTSNIGSTTTFFTVVGNGFTIPNTYVLTDGTYDLHDPDPPNNVTAFNIQDISQSPFVNSGPVISYNRKSGAFNPDDAILVVGWNHNTGSSSLPLSLLQFADGRGCDVKIASNPNLFANNYLEIPMSPTGSEGVLSISGEQTNNMFYSWHDNITFEHSYKARTYGSVLRTGTNVHSGFLDAYIHSNTLIINTASAQDSEPLTLNVFSLDGKLVLNRMVKSNIQLDLLSIINTTGFYSVQLLGRNEVINIKYIRP